MINTEQPAARRDWFIAAVFFLAGLSLFAPLRTRYAYLWDSVEFAEAIRDYDVGLSQPHPPGYFLYVMLGRAVNLVVGDPHASLVWLSVVAGAALVAVLYLLGTELFGRRAGGIAGGLALTSPLVWFYSCVALTYLVDAFLVCVLVWWCWRCRQRGGNRWDAVGLGLLLGIISGVRQQSLFGLAPLVGLTLWSFPRQRLMNTGLALATCALVVGIWVVSMLHLTGGWEVYSGGLRQIAQFHAHKTFARGGIQALTWNVFFAALFCLNALFLAALAVPAAGRMPGTRVVLWWIVPVFLLAVAVGYTEAPGHVFTYLPGLILLAGAGLARWRQWMPALVIGANLFVFLAWPPAWDGALWGTIPTARGLRGHDELIAKTVALVRAQYDPAETILLHQDGDLFFGLRHFQMHLPEFANYRIDPDEAMIAPPGKPLLRTLAGRMEFVAAVPADGWRVALHVVPPGREATAINGQEVAGSDGRLFEERR